MNNKKLVFLFVFSFILPLLLAFTVLKLDWLPGNTVNNGNFLIPEVTLNEWAKIEPKPWSIALLTYKNCTATCLAHRQQVRDLYIALGQKQNKVDLVLLGDHSAEVEGFKNYQPVNNALQQEVLYLIDQMGLVVFYYPLVADPQANRATRKGLIKDLKKLLNYARSS
ncbi:transmembrane cytochrome oxidase associated protein [Psychromonas sp.]|uniref:transmembrane cytochrome oxidase associated protein n=1 Tax=Psychromonas sp. TaxID=1884585 RepID=UPI003563F299